MKTLLLILLIVFGGCSGTAYLRSQATLNNTPISGQAECLANEPFECERLAKEFCGSQPWVLRDDKRIVTYINMHQSGVVHNEAPVALSTSSTWRSICFVCL